MRLSGFLKCFFLLVLLFFSVSEIFSGESQGKKVQTILSMDEITSLDSTSSHTWYATYDEINVETFFENWRNGNLKEKNWGEYKVPGLYLTRDKSNLELKRVTFIKKFFLPEKWKTPQHSLRLGVISDRDRTYLNGTLIDETGEFGSAKPQAYDRVRIYRIPENILLRGKENVLLIEVEKYFPDEFGITQDSTAIGPTEIIESVFLRTEYIKIILLMIYLTVGGYFLFLFVRRRKESENLYFGLFALCLVLYQFMRNQIKYDLGIELLTMKKFEYTILTALMPLFYNFMRAFFKFKRNYVMIGVDIIFLGQMIYFAIATDIVAFNKVNSNLQQPLYLLYIGFTIYYLIRRIMNKNTDAMFMLAGMITMVASLVLDILSTRQIIVLPRMTGYAFLIFILGLATILANKFVRLNEEVEDLNASLEKKVEDRTRELNQTLSQVHALKVQQDGDYFLTSLLLNPLSANNNDSTTVLSQFFAKQKKSFEFKNVHHEIGGDICITSNVDLLDKKYTAFVNGDAMGKSIQGAGGALVMGVVFNAVLTRSKLKIQKNKSPELWLKEAFLDLQHVFESFDGSMYISCVMGLVDEATGFMYFVNAEHPWTVLYRDGKASFIEEELGLRKLGTFGNDEAFYIKTFQLLPGDVIIAGSDGRDDIQTGTDAKGNRIINEDETLFLRRVEEGKGSIEDIAEIIMKSGILTDDFTLLRLSFMENANYEEKIEPEEFISHFEKAKDLLRNDKLAEGTLELEEAYKAYRGNEENIKLLAQVHFKGKDFGKAAKYFDEYLSLRPDSTDMFLYASFAHKMTKNLNKAADYGEQILLRNPRIVKNLINLADIYKNLNISGRAAELVEKALSIEPENSRAIKIKEFLDSQQS